MGQVTPLVNIQLKMLSCSLCCAGLSLLNRCYQTIRADPWVVVRSSSLGNQLMSVSGSRKCQRKSYFSSRLLFHDISSSRFCLLGAFKWFFLITWKCKDDLPQFSPNPAQISHFWAIGFHLSNLMYLFWLLNVWTADAEHTWLPCCSGAAGQQIRPPQASFQDGSKMHCDRSLLCCRSCITSILPNKRPSLVSVPRSVSYLAAIKISCWQPQTSKPAAPLPLQRDEASFQLKPTPGSALLGLLCFVIRL